MHTIETFADNIKAHDGNPLAIKSIWIDMPSAFIKGVTAKPPNASITFDKVHAHASATVDKMRRIELRTAPSLKALRWKLLKDRDSLERTARAQLYKVQLLKILAQRHARLALAEGLFRAAKS